MKRRGDELVLDPGESIILRGTATGETVAPRIRNAAVDQRLVIRLAGGYQIAYSWEAGRERVDG